MVSRNEPSADTLTATCCMLPLESGYVRAVAAAKLVGLGIVNGCFAGLLIETELGGCQCREAACCDFAL